MHGKEYIGTTNPAAISETYPACRFVGFQGIKRRVSGGSTTKRGRGLGASTRTHPWGALDDELSAFKPSEGDSAEVPVIGCCLL